MNKLDKTSSDPNANALLHEISEAYIGATNSLKSGISAPVAQESDINNYKSAYWQAHKAAYSQPDINFINNDKSIYYTTIYTRIIGIDIKNSNLYYKGKQLIQFYKR